MPLKMPLNETDIFYTISKDNKFFGYLLGSFHMNLNPIDYDNKKNYFIPFLKECKTFFLEANLPHYTQLGMGLERALLNGIAQENLTITIKNFEEAIFQHAMLNNRIWIGIKIITLPWHHYTYIKKYPRFFLFLNKIISKGVLIYNIFYNVLHNSIHSQAVQIWQQEQSNLVLQLFKKYQEGKAILLSQEDEKTVFMKERNLDYVEQLMTHLTEEKPLFCVVGAAHLPGEYGLVYLLSKAGYELTPINQDETKDSN